MIKISQIKISNFRSFTNEENIIRELDVLNIFAGRNNVGKTNVLRAINLFFNPKSYNPSIDRNAIKEITKGASKDPVITVDFIDDELETGKESKYQIYCNLNKEESELYKTNSKHAKLNSSSKIKKYLNAKFKCVYLSTTDQDLSSQAFSLLNDMVLEYFKKKHKKIKQTVEEFERQYDLLLGTFKEHINDIESDLDNEFKLFRENHIEIKPKLVIDDQAKITEFLLKNISLKLDDDYAQIIDAKGAGVQRTSVILLTFFLLNEIFQKHNKIILLDEPEAFLYPLLTTGLKDSILELVNNENNKSQLFITTHSREFLKEVNNPIFRFYNIRQSKRKQSYQRSKNDFDIVKNSVVSKFTNEIKNQVLKNYGLLDEVDDHREIIICEGKTDKNYIEYILESKPYRPQIRYEKYKNDENDLDFNFVGSGAESVVSILVYLDKVSQVHRKIFILLDGDPAGEKAKKKINSEISKFRNFEIEVYSIDSGKEIEDMVFDEDLLVETLKKTSEDFSAKQQEFVRFLSSKHGQKNLMDLTKEFISYHSINYPEGKMKGDLSQNIDRERMNKNWLLDRLNSFFYSDEVF